MKKYALALLLLSLLALWPFFKKGYFESHDGEWMLIRFTAFHQALAAGQFPVRFVDRLNNNYGYPVANFLYPLPFYLAEIPKLIGFTFVDSVKIIFAASAAGSVLVMFWALSQKFSKTASFAGAAVYLFVPYRFVDLYVRGSFGENLAFLFLPLILGCLFKIEHKKYFLPLLSGAIALLILSHNVIAVLFVPLLAVLSAILLKRKKLISLVAAFFLGIALSAFFWLPALYDMRFVRLSQIKVSEISHHLVPLTKLFSTAWGFGPQPTGDNSFSVQLGLVSILTIAVAAIFQITQKKRSALVIFLIVASLASVALMTKYSLFIWQAVPNLDIIQFPWRLLSIVVFSSAILCAYVVDKAGRKATAATIVVTLSVISTFFYTRPSVFTDKSDSFYATNEGTTTVRDEYLPLWAKEKPAERANEKIIVDPAISQIKSIEIMAANYKAQITSNQDNIVTVQSIYFPGWKVEVNGKEVPVYYGNKFGFVTFWLPQGDHEVIIKYAKSGVHALSEFISLMALFASGILFIKWRKQNS